MKKRVVGIGMAGVDFLGVVNHLSGPGSKMEMSQFSIQTGGSVGTELVTSASMGLETSFIGKISDDMFGDFIYKSLKQIGVDLRGLMIEKGKVSPFSYIAVEVSGRNRLLFHTRGNCSPLEINELDLSLIDGGSALLLDGYQMKASIHAAEYSNKKGIPVILDAAALTEGMGELVSLTNVLIASERFASETAPMGELEDALLELRRMGPETVVLTLGSEGSIGLTGNNVIRQSAYKTKDTVDTTGAGGIYRGAFVYGWLQKWDLEKCMRFASVAAGLSCASLGGLAGIPDKSRVMEIIG